VKNEENFVKGKWGDECELFVLLLFVVIEFFNSFSVWFLLYFNRG